MIEPVKVGEFRGYEIFYFPIKVALDHPWYGCGGAVFIQKIGTKERIFLPVYASSESQVLEKAITAMKREGYGSIIGADPVGVYLFLMSAFYLGIGVIATIYLVITKLGVL